MKRFSLFVTVCLAVISSAMAQPTFSKYEHTLDYFLPKYFPDIKNGGEIKLSEKFNPNIPQPKDILGFELGEMYPEWYMIVSYMKTLDKESDRVKLRTVGYTYEKRPIIEVTISSPKNIERIDEIRAEQQKLSDVTTSQSLDISKMPTIVTHINAVHGNEHSSASASMAVAYFYAASEDPKVLDILDKSVLVIVPSINPDGVNRFSAWCNAESSIGKHIADVNTREYSLNEPKPLSRTNHYWHDANRDHILTQHPEGRTFAKVVCEWMPNMLYDNHESSQTRGLFCSPGILEQLHPLLTMESQDKARHIGKYTTAILERVGQNTYSDARYDDYYLGRGDVYGDIQGIVNILIEQSNSRGFAKPLGNGKVLRLPRSIQNHTYVSIVSLFAAYQNREDLHNYQRNFFLRQAELIKQSKSQGYIFNTRGDKGLEYVVMEWMKNQYFDVYKLAKDVKVDGVTYRASDSYIVPADQRYFLKFKGVWEEITKFNTDNFYDISTWALKYAFNVEECEVESADGLLGEKVTNFKFPEGKVCESNQYGYLVDAKGLYSHNMLYAMLDKGVHVDIATEPFKVNGEVFGCGTAYIPLAGQPLSAEDIHKELAAAAKMNGVDVKGVKRPLSLAKSARLTHLPRVAMVTGSGISDFESGEIWHILDLRFGLTPTRIDINRLHQIKDFSEYDVFIIPSGESLLPVSNDIYKRLNEFVNAGGTLIVTGEANGILNNTKLVKMAFKQIPADQPKSEKIAGAIVKSNIDNSDPLGYGYPDGVALPIFKRGSLFIDTTATTFDKAVVKGAAEPYLSGYISQHNLSRLASNPIVVKKKVGNGTVIYSTENLTFRSFWYGTTKLFMNSIYFGNL